MRDPWSVYFLKIAHAVSTRATCDRLHVGCVMVHPVSRAILSTGYNGSTVGNEHCDDVGHDMVDGHCVRTVHAEANAIVQAAANGTPLRDAIAYMTAYPCWKCAQLMVNARIAKIVYAKAYRVDPRVEEAAHRARMQIVNVECESPEAELVALREQNASLLRELETRLDPLAIIDPGSVSD